MRKYHIMQLHVLDKMYYVVFKGDHISDFRWQLDVHFVDTEADSSVHCGHTKVWHKKYLMDNLSSSKS